MKGLAGRARAIAGVRPPYPGRLPRNLRGAQLLGIVVGAGLTTPGCRREPEQTSPPPVPTLETVDVEPPPDARVDVSRDVQEVRRVEQLSGVLPSDFPTGLPLPPGASLVDQGPRWVELLIGRPPATVRGEFMQRVRGAGWQVETTGTDAWALQRDGTRARASLAAQGPSTRLRFDY
jgi:hypothetical protein